MKPTRPFSLTLALFPALLLLGSFWLLLARPGRADSSLALYWPFDETAGATTFADGSGNGYDGTCSGAACPTAGYAGSAGTALHFDGTANYVETPYQAALNPASFTVAAWARVDGGSGSYRSVLTSRDSAPLDQRGYIFYASDLDKWEFWLGAGDTGWAIAGDTPVTPGVWTHLAGVFDAAAGASTGTMHFYVNGQPAGSQSNVPFVRNQQRPLRVGAGATEGIPQFYFPGAIDEVHVYGRALSAAEVGVLHTASLQAFDDGYQVGTNPALTVPAPGVLGNDTLSGSSETLTATLATAPAHGTVALAPDGSFVYTPAVGYTGTDTFAYTAHAGVLADTAVVSVSVSGSLRLYLPLDEAAGATTFADVTGQGHDATCAGSGCPTAGVEGKFGTALHFDGSDDTLEVAYDAALNPESFTVAAWARIDAGSSGYRAVVTSRDTPGGGTKGYTLYATPDDRWQFWLGNGSWWYEVGTAPVVANTWTHLAGVYDAATNEVQLYVNGEPAGSHTYATFAPNLQRPLRVGAGATEGAADFFFPGRIDDVRVYAHALTQAEVQTLLPPAIGAGDDAYTTRADRILSVAAPGVLANDWAINPAGPLAATLLVPPPQGTLLLAPDGGFVYTPTAGLPGSYTFTYRAQSGSVTDTAVVTLTVTPGSSPVAVDDQYGTVQGVPLSILHDEGTLSTLFSGDYVAHGNMFDVTAAGQDIHITGFGVHIAESTSTTAAIYYRAGGYAGAEQNPALWTLLGTEEIPGRSDSRGRPTPVTIGGLTIPAGQTYGFYVEFNSIGILYTDYTGIPGSGIYSNADLTLRSGTANAYHFGNYVGNATWNGEIYYYTGSDVLANDSDPDGDPLSATLEAAPAHGSLLFNGNGTFIYTPTYLFLGEDTFTYRVGDGGATDTGTVTITVVPNQPPVAVGDSYGAVKNQPLTVAAPGLLANDTDAEGTPLTARLFTAPAQGTASVSPDGAFTYTPAPDFLGTDTFVYVADDGVLTGTATVTVTVMDKLALHLPLDEAAGATTFTDLSDYGHDAVCSGAACPATNGEGPAGMAPLFDGVDDALEVPYTPQLNPSSFTVMAWARVTGGSSYRSIVSSRNGPTQGYALYAGGFEKWEFHVSNGSDLVGLTNPDPLVYNTWTHVAGVYDAGTQTMQLYVDGELVASRTTVFVPNNQYPLRVGAGATEDSTPPFSFYFPGQIDDVRLYTRALSEAEIQALVPAVILAAGDSYTVRAGRPLKVAAPGVLSNDQVIAHADPLTTTLLAPPVQGSLALALDGGFVYTPTPAFTGSVNFTYVAHAGRVTDTAVVTLTAVPNAAPTAADDAYLGRDGVLGFVTGAPYSQTTSFAGGSSNWTGNMFDLTAGPRAIHITGVDVHLDTGSHTVSVYYKPGTYAGSETNQSAWTLLDTQIVNGQGTGNPTRVEIGGLTIPAGQTYGLYVMSPEWSICSPGDGTYSNEDLTLTMGTRNNHFDSFHTNYRWNGTIHYTFPGVLDNDTDADGDALSASLHTGPAHGELTLNGDGTFVYTPTASLFGVSDTFTYIASDGVLTATAVVTLTNQSSLRLHLPLDEPAGGVTFADVSGYGHETACAGAGTCPTAGVSGKEGTALRFDGADDVAEIPYTSQLNPGTYANPGSFTVMAWVRVADGSSGLRPVLSSSRSYAQYYSTYHEGYGLYATGSDEWQFWVGNRTETWKTVGSSPVVAGAWTHVTGVYDPDTYSIKIYVNGRLAGSRGSVSGVINIFPNQQEPFRIGAGIVAPGGPSFHFPGEIDDVRFYARALSEADIQALLTSQVLAYDDTYTVAQNGVLAVPAPGLLGNDIPVGNVVPPTATLTTLPQHGVLVLQPDGSFTYTPTAGFMGTDSFTYTARAGVLADTASGTLVVMDSLRLHLPLDETGAATTFADSSIYNHDATCSGASCPTTGVEGKTGRPPLLALQFGEGAIADDYVEVPYTPALNPESFTIMAWVSAAGGSSGYRAVVTSRDTNAGNRGYILYATADNQWQFWLGDGSTGWHAVGTAPVVADTWTHLAGVYDATNDTIRLYVDGQPAGELATGAFARNMQRPLRVGAGATEGAADFFFPGRMDDVRLYAHALSQAEIQALILPAVRAHDDGYITREEQPLAVAAPGVLANDYPDNFTGTLTATLLVPPAHGTLSFALDGSFVYTPEADYVGTDSFAYTAHAGVLADTAVVSLTVGDGLYLHLPLDETAGATSFADVSGNGHDAACSGASCPTAGMAGKSGAALAFDGADDYVETPYTSQLNRDSFTVMAWARVSDGSDYRALVTSRNALIQGYALYANPLHMWEFHVANGSTVVALPGTHPITYNTWTHLAGVYDAETQIMQFYVNGELVGNTTTAFVPNDQYPLRVGAGATELVTPTFHFPGRIDDVRVYGRPLSQTEIQAMVPPEVYAEDDAYTDYTVYDHQALTVAAPSLLDNDYTINHIGTLTASVLLPPTRGTLSLAPDGTFVYTPALNFPGTYTFTYLVQSDHLTDTATVTLVVLPHLGTFDDHYNAATGVPLSTPPRSDSLTTFFGDSGQGAGNMFNLTAGSKDVHITAFDINLNALGWETPVAVYYKAGPYQGSEQNPNDWTLLGSESFYVQSLGNPTRLNVGDLTVPARETYALYITVMATDPNARVGWGEYDVDYDNEDLIVADGISNDYPFGAYKANWGWSGRIYYDTERGVLANDFDLNGDPITASLGVGPAHGVVALAGDGNFVYTPTYPYMGDDIFTYIASDGVLTDTGTVTVTVGANTPPTAVGDSYEVIKGETLLIPAPGLLANDGDPDGQPLTAALFAVPGNGTATVNADGSFNYTPAAGFLGTDTFIYVADDGILTSTATVTLTVMEKLRLHLPLDETPGSTTFVDTSGNGHHAACSGSACPTAGVEGAQATALQFDGSSDYLEIPYTADLNPNSFTIMAWARANSGSSGTRSVVTARDGNQHQGYSLYAAADDTWQFWIGTGSNWAIAGNQPISSGNWTHLAGVYDAYSQTLTLYVNGEPAGSATGEFVPNPANPLRVGAGATEGAATFFFPGRIDDVRLYGHALTPAEIGLLSTRVTALGEGYSIRQGKTLSVAAPGVLANDMLTGTGTLIAALAVPPNHGTLTLNADGAFVYTPTTGFVGTDAFTYTASYGEATDTAVVTLTILPNFAPVTVADTYTSYKDTALIVPAPGVLGNDSDPNGDALQALLAAAPAHGEVALRADGSFAYTPTTDYVGTDTFSYVAGDGMLTATARVTLTISSAHCYVEMTGDNVSDYQSSDAGAVQAAIDNAAPGALLKVAGTCAGVQARAGSNQTIYISQSVTLQGGYTHTNWLASSSPEALTTTLDAQGSGRVVFIPAGVAVTLDGFLLTGGATPAGNGGGLYNAGTLTLTHATLSGNQALFGGQGGGIYNDRTSPALVAVVFDGNSATQGGGMYNDGKDGTSSPTLNNVTFSGNLANNEGGGMYNWGASGNSSPTLVDVTFSSNQATRGGGMYNIVSYAGGSSSPTLTNVTFSSNTAGYGGGIYSDAGSGTSSPTLTDVTFSNNVATNSYGGGGGIYHASGSSGTGSPTLTRVTFSGNSATGNSGGGGMLAIARGGNTSPVLRDVTFRNNSATAGGGALSLEGQSAGPGGGSNFLGATISNSLFIANGTSHVRYGGYGVTTQPRFFNCTFSGAASQAVYVAIFYSSLPLHFQNSIFWGNNGDMSNDDAALDVHYSIVEQENYTGTANLYADPRFVDAAAGNLHLRPGSPAVDAADPAACPAADIRGVARPQGAGCDMGAYERLAFSLLAMLNPGPALHLEWTPIGSAYTIWHSSQPYAGYTPLAAHWIESHYDVAGFSTPVFYEVYDEMAGEVTNRIGVFSFTLAPGE